MRQAAVITNSGVVYCPTRRSAITETIQCWNVPSWTHSALRTPNFPKAKNSDDPIAVIATLSGEGFYHFLLESLPRLSFLRQAGIPSGVKIVANGKSGSFAEAWLHDAGVEPSIILWADDLFHLHAPDVYFTSYLMRDRGPDAWTIQTLRSMFPTPAPSSATQEKWLWISRADSSKRQPLWEKQFLREFPKFECVHLSSCSPAEQRLLFRSACRIAGPHGAGFSNLVFCSAGARVLEIFPLDLHMPLYQRLAHASGLFHSELVADFDSTSLSSALIYSICHWLDSSVPATK
ncbi:MAG: glycosyltransferase family 61 protein [Blastochloris sp.]|nr:glycosyltransferase family 61 protein [Blastochloris sp.]